MNSEREKADILFDYGLPLQFCCHLIQFYTLLFLRVATLMSDLGEEFAKICIQWLKKALVYMHFDCILPEFSPFRNLKKNIGKLNSLTVRKKKKK